MRRRDFFQRSGIVTVASLPLWAGPKNASAQTASSHERNALTSDTATVWHFHDRWRFDRLEGLKLRQGSPQWQADATFVEPNIGPLSAWPTVFKEANSNGWRMLYSAAWKPLQLMTAVSPDGKKWAPDPQPSIRPSGEKRAPHHLFTLPGGSAGGVYIDRISDDGFPFKLFAHQRGDDVFRRALNDPSHLWHNLAKTEGPKKYFVEDFTLVSRDGLHWKPRRDLTWSQEHWHPEPPIFGFFNHHRNEHCMTVRPGWGDRRQCIQSTTDFNSWNGPQLLLQPDVLDEDLVELYGMPVFPYGDGYVGLLWVFHSQSSEPASGFNRFVGRVDCQLAFSSNGTHFTRGPRAPFIACNPPGEHGGGSIQPSCLVESDKEIRIYSAATKLHHGKGSEARKRQITDNASILLHTLRKDGLMFVESVGNWGHLVSRPLVFLDPVTRDSSTVKRDAPAIINARLPHGQLQFQLVDLESRPVEGFTFEDCVSMENDDSTNFPLRWRDAHLADIRGRIVRLEIRLRDAQLFSIRAAMHFIDAQDRWMVEDGQVINT